jgi:hypothetical protein
VLALMDRQMVMDRKSCEHFCSYVESEAGVSQKLKAGCC